VLSPAQKHEAFSLPEKQVDYLKNQRYRILLWSGTRALFVSGQKTLERRRGTPGGA
jgi:hypothetical protein